MRCNCEDYPCCGHTDNDESSPYADMTDDEIKEEVYRRMQEEDGYEWGDDDT